MRNTFLGIIVILTIFGVQGRTLTPAEALIRVKSENTATKAPAVRAVESAEPRLVLTQTTEAGLPAVYVFENSDASSLVLVSADDVATPLLGYTDRAEADATDMPPQLKWWLEEYARQIAYAQLEGSSIRRNASSETVDPKIVAAPAARQRIAPMVKTTWAQSEPYNLLCPQSTTGSYTSTGCVATAMAQMMKYFEWPQESPTGVCSVAYQDNTYTLDLSTITFDWANMLNEYPQKTSGTDAERTAVATLMQACGYSVGTSYGVGSSGATTANCIAAFKNNFGYDGGAFYATREKYTRNEWYDMVYNNLLNCGPLLYAGNTNFAGHAFICDGYNTDDMFHFNWGWNGRFDGYYALDALYPEIQDEVSDLAGGYIYYQSATIGVQKPTGQEAQLSLSLSSSNGLTGTLDGTNLTFNGGMYNYTGNTITVDIYIKSVSIATGEITRYKRLSGIEIPHKYGYPSFSNYAGFLISKDGSYNVYVETTAAGNTDKYYPLIVSDGMPDHFILTKEGNTFTVDNEASTYVAPKITFTDFSDEVYYYNSNGSYQIIIDPHATYTIECVGNNGVQGGLALQLIKDDKVFAVSSGIFYDLLPGESRDYSNSFRLTRRTYDGETLSLGETYDLCVFDPTRYGLASTTGSTKIGEVSVVEYPGCEMAADSFEIDGDADDVNTNHVPYKGTISCSSGAYNGTVMAAIFTDETCATNKRLYIKDIAPIYITANRQTEFTGTLPYTLEPGTKYYSKLYYQDPITYAYTDLGPTLAFTTGNSTSGLTTVTNESPEGLIIGFDNGSRTLAVHSATAVAAVSIFGINGAAVGAPISFCGDMALSDLSGLPAGIYVVHAADAVGNTATEKIAIK